MSANLMTYEEEYIPIWHYLWKPCGISRVPRGSWHNKLMCQPRPPSVSIGETNTDVIVPTKHLWWFDKWKKTKMAKGWNYKHLGNCLPVVLHCMLAFCRVFQNIWRRYWIKTSLTSFHWQKTHVLVVQKLYQEKGEIGLTTSCSCMSLRAVFSLI